METARNAHKPILVQKSNIGNHAKLIAQSHTASLSSDDAVVSAALKQCGIARVTDRENLVNTLKILPLPPMKGNRLAIISRSGGHAIIAADATESVGFELAPLSPLLIKNIENHLRGNVIKLTNPLDIGDLFDYDMYPQIVEKLLREKYVDGVVFMHAYFSALEGDKSRTLFEKIAQLSKKHQKPVGICVATDEDELNKLRKDVSYPIFGVPSAVIRALALSRDFYLKQQDKRRFKTTREVKVSPTSKVKVAKILKNCKKLKRSPFLQEGMDIFSLYGIPVVKSVWVKNVNEAVAAAKKVGYPVVMKIVSREISHKTDFGGVQLNLKSEDHVRDAYNEMMTNIRKQAPKAKIEGVVVQPMLKRGWELILGAKQDPNFGPIVLAGLGGIFVEIFKDTSIRVCPFDKNEAREMLTELKGYPILKGARGDKPYDIAYVEEAVLRLSRLISDFPQIKEIDINPFYVLHKGNGGFALDARIIL
jgi:acetyltransferase